MRLHCLWLRVFRVGLLSTSESASLLALVQFCVPRICRSLRMSLQIFFMRRTSGGKPSVGLGTPKHRCLQSATPSSGRPSFAQFSSELNSSHGSQPFGSKLQKKPAPQPHAPTFSPIYSFIHFRAAFLASSYLK